MPLDGDEILIEHLLDRARSLFEIPAECKRFYIMLGRRNQSWIANRENLHWSPMRHPGRPMRPRDYPEFRFGYNSQGTSPLAHGKGQHLGLTVPARGY